MRILHAIRSVNPEGGGPIEGVRQLGHVNVRRGHTIEVVSLDSPDAPYLRDFPLRVHALGPGTLKYGFCGALVPWLRANAQHYDIVIVNGIWQYHGFAVWRAFHKSDIPYVVFTHGMLDPWFKSAYPLKHLKKMLYWPWGEYRVLRDARAVLFTSEEERVLARQPFRPYACKEVVVNYGTAGSPNSPETDLNAFYGRFPNLRNRRVATFLGRLHPKKGCDLLIEAFAAALAKDPDWMLLMCGPDQIGWRNSLQAMATRLGIGDRITWADMVKNEMKWGAYRASEVFILPSHQENFGITVAEALSCNVPALISQKVNIWREVEQVGGGITATDDLAGTCAMMSRWLQMTELERLEMRQRARQCFEEKFEIHRAADTLIHVLQDVVGHLEPVSV